MDVPTITVGLDRKSDRKGKVVSVAREDVEKFWLAYNVSQGNPNPPPITFDSVTAP